MTDAQQLAEEHTRSELDDMATEAGVDGAASLPNKEAVAQAYLDAGGEATAATQAQGVAAVAPAATIGEWTVVQDGPDYFTAERYVESLGLQKVSEGAASMEELAAACEAYDAHQEALAPGWPNQARS